MSDLTWVVAGVVVTYGTLAVYAAALSLRLRRRRRELEARS